MDMTLAQFHDLEQALERCEKERAQCEKRRASSKAEYEGLTAQTRWREKWLGGRLGGDHAQAAMLKATRHRANLYTVLAGECHREEQLAKDLLESAVLKQLERTGRIREYHEFAATAYARRAMHGYLGALENAQKLLCAETLEQVGVRNDELQRALEDYIRISLPRDDLPMNERSLATDIARTARAHLYDPKKPIPIEENAHRHSMKRLDEALDACRRKCCLIERHYALLKDLAKQGLPSG